VLPTFAKLAGAAVPADRPIDGRDIGPLLRGVPGAKSPHEYYLFPHLKGALRNGQWKFYPWPEGADKKMNKNATAKKGVQLYDLGHDIGERTNVAAQHPELVRQLEEVYRRMTEDLKKNKLPG
jgi:arylsulfatase A